MALLAASLIYAWRLQRALRGLKQDQAALDALLARFGSSTSAAQSGIDTLRALTDTAAAQMVRQTELGHALKDDLAVLIDRGDRLADRLEALVRLARPIATEPARPELHPLPEPDRVEPSAAIPRVRSQAERDLLTALNTVRS